MHVQTIIDESIASFFEEWVEKMKRTDPSPEESLDHILKGGCIISIKKKKTIVCLLYAYIQSFHVS